jgi:hypothetical protein
MLILGWGGGKGGGGWECKFCWVIRAALIFEVFSLMASTIFRHLTSLHSLLQYIGRTPATHLLFLEAYMGSLFSADKCVLDSCRYLQLRGFDVTYLPVGKDGLLKLEELEAAFRPDTALVSVMTVNNEIGERPECLRYEGFRHQSITSHVIYLYCMMLVWAVQLGG